MDFENPRLSVELLDELVALGLDNELFRQLHHARNYKNTIGAHRRWCRDHRGRFDRDGTNARTARRFSAALEQRRAGVAWPEAIAAARAQVPFDGSSSTGGSSGRSASPPVARTSRRAQLRPLVLDRMQRLVDRGLGWFGKREPQRATFVLDPAHPAASVLSTRTAARNFIREDEGSLLFRNASRALGSLLPPEISSLRFDSPKGLEFRWTALDAQTVEKLFDAVHALAFASTADPAELDARVEELLTRPKPALPPEGQRVPPRVSRQGDVFARNPDVIAWVLAESAGHCERCRAPAPFQRANGQPFLEVHHMRWLADGGSDTVDNAVALCPNCHRYLHHAADRQSAAAALYSTVDRLRG